MYINKKVIIKAKTEALGFNFYKIRGEDKFTFDNSRRAFSLKSGLLRSSTKCSADAIFRSLFAPAPAGALGLEALGPPPNGTFIDSDCGRFAILSLSLNFPALFLQVSFTVLTKQRAETETDRFLLAASYFWRLENRCHVLYMRVVWWDTCVIDFERYCVQILLLSFSVCRLTTFLQSNVKSSSF